MKHIHSIINYYYISLIHLTSLPSLPSFSLIRSGSALYDIISMVKFDVVPKYFRQRYLLSDFGLVTPTAEEGSANSDSHCSHTVQCTLILIL
jgi:hypothetical protein